MPTDSAELLQPLRDDPARSAVLTDVDGTLAPIVGDPAEAAVLPAARDTLAELAESYAVVACVSGRPAELARRLVGLDDLVYLGNHGLERLEPGARQPRASAALAGHETAAAQFVAGLDPARLEGAGITVEDKGPIKAMHWRRAADERAAERIAGAIAVEAEATGLATHRGRKVLELRPPVPFDKGAAIAELLADLPVRRALYAGDDRTDLDGFAALRELTANGDLESAVCVGIASEESPSQVAARADVVVSDPAAFAALLRQLVPAPRPVR